MKTIDRRNIFFQILSALKVSYTEKYSFDFFEKHPLKETMLGVSRMLNTYGIATLGLKISSKEDVYKLKTPFLAEVKYGMVVILDMDCKSRVFRCNWYNKKGDISEDYFFSEWTGAALLMEANKDSKEPQYEKHLLSEYIQKITSFCVNIAFYFLLIISIAHANWGIELAFYPRIGQIVLNLMALYVCYLLLCKQIHLPNRMVDRICASNSKVGENCDRVLGSNAAKVLNLITLSEIGTAFFLTNILFLLYAKDVSSLLIVTQSIAVMFSFWSILYQKLYLKGWCKLCLLICIIIIAQMTLNILTIFYHSIVIILSSSWIFLMVIWSSAFILLSYIVHQVCASIDNTREREKERINLRKLKLNKEVFRVVHEQKEAFLPSKDFSSITFGDSSLLNCITILSNPYCEPCSEIHRKIRNVLDFTRVRYLFTSYNEDHKNIALSIISYHHEHPSYDSWNRLSLWYDTKDESLFPEMSVDKMKAARLEFANHQQWAENVNAIATPLILLNDRPLPNGYNIEDLCFILEENNNESLL